MTTAPTRPAPTRPTPTNARPAANATGPMKLDFTPRKPTAQAKRLLVYAVGGFGKTTLGAYAPKPFMLMSNAETGYDVLLEHGRVPEIPGCRVDSFESALAALNAFSLDRGDRETLVIDSLSALEDMLIDRLQSALTPEGFQNYGKGYGMLSTDWLKLLSAIEQIAKSGCNVIMLAHATVTNFKNPAGADYKRYVPDLYDSDKASTLRPTLEKADAVLFGNFLSIVEVSKHDQKKNLADQKGKGIGDTVRVIYTERRDAFEAKNRYGMVPEIELSNDPSHTWAQVWSAITGKEA